LAVCLVCGKFEEVDLKKAMNGGWVFVRCPECQRGTPFDIIATYLSKTVDEKYLMDFVQNIGSRTAESVHIVK